MECELPFLFLNTEYIKFKMRKQFDEGQYYGTDIIYSMSQLDMQVGYSLISEKIKVTNLGPNYYLSIISCYKQPIIYAKIRLIVFDI